MCYGSHGILSPPSCVLHKKQHNAIMTQYDIWPGQFHCFKLPLMNLCTWDDLRCYWVWNHCNICEDQCSSLLEMSMFKQQVFAVFCHGWLMSDQWPCWIYITHTHSPYLDVPIFFRGPLKFLKWNHWTNQYWWTSFTKMSFPCLSASTEITGKEERWLGSR